MPYIQYPSLGGGSFLPENGSLYWDDGALKLVTTNFEVLNNSSFNGNVTFSTDIFCNGEVTTYSNLNTSNILLTNSYSGQRFYFIGTPTDGMQIADDTFTGWITIAGDNGIDYGKVVIRTVPSMGSFVMENLITYSTNFGYEQQCTDNSTTKNTLIQISPNNFYKVQSTDPILLTSDYFVKLYNPNGGSPALIVVNNGTGPAYSIRLDDGVGSLVWGVQANGAIFMGSMDDADAQNGSVYYSTNSSKLVYKDAGGTVNDLY